MADSAIILSAYQYTMEEAFPDVPLPITPFGERVLIQLRNPPKKKGVIELVNHTQEREKDIAQIGRVAAIGGGCFRNRQSGAVWHEGEWFKVGDIITCPKYGGDRWFEKQADGTEVQFVIFRDLDIIGLVRGDPLAVRTFI